MNSNESDFLENNFENETNDFYFFKIIKSRKRIFCTTVLLIFSISTCYTLFKFFFRPEFKGEFSLLVTDPLEDSKTSSLQGKEDLISQLASNTTSNDITTLIELLQSKNIIFPIAKKYNMPIPIFSKKLGIKVGGGVKRFERAEGILNISFKGGNLQETKFVLRDLSDLYLETALEQRRKRLSDGLKFLNNQEPGLQEKTFQIQSKIEKFRIENNLIEPLLESKAIKEKQINLENQKRLAETEKNNLEKVRVEIVKGNLVANSFREGIFSNDSQFPGTKSNGEGLNVSDSDQGLLKQYSDLELKMAKASVTFTKESKVIKSLKSKLKVLKPILLSKQLETVDLALKRNTSKLDNIESQLKKNNAEFITKPSLLKEYETLQQKLNIISTNLKALVEAREILSLEIAQNSYPWSVISDPFVNPWPSSPSVPRNLIFSILIALIAGYLASLLRDRFDNVFHLSTEIEDFIKLPILSTITYRKDIDFSVEETKNNEDDQDSEQKFEEYLYKESFRELYSSFRFLSTDKPLKTFLISSALPSEGKSSTTIMFAQTLAEFDKRILLIDADLKKPSLHTKLGIDNITGLSNLVIDESLNWEEILNNISISKSIDFISAGMKPPNSVRLLNSQRIQNIVKDIKSSNKYDFIIFDTPPVIGLTDTPIISTLCDASFILISLDNVEKQLAIQAIQKLNKTNTPFLGVIANTIKESTQLNKKRFGGYGYGYGKNYGYGDNYGYGYGDEDKKNSKNNDKEIKDNELENENKIKNKLNKYISNKIDLIFSWLDEK